VHGFSADEGVALSVHDQEMRRRGRSGDGKAFRFASFVFEGRLQVIDADRFRRALQRGIGAEKAFGFGLLQIAPVRAR
jgi:CRISPR system Cascade subunit CasE